MSATAAGETSSRRSFYLRKLHSLTGVVPIGGFLLMHLFENSKAAQGREAFNDVVTEIDSLPFVLALEMAGIWIPIAFHAIFGFVIIIEGKSNALSHPYARNWLYSLQRWSGVLAFAFIVFHFVNFRAMPREEFLPAHGNDPYQIVQDQLLRAAWVLPFYLLGLAACVFHFANGLWGFLVSWGFVIGPRAQRLAGLACGAAGLGTMALGIKALVAFLPPEHVLRRALGSG